MLRAVVLAEERRWLLLAAVFAATLFFGFGVQAAGSLYLRWTESPIVTHYRTTLSYTSALLGDAFLIPLVNVFVTSQLWEWRRRPRLREIVAAACGGALLTVSVHLYQAANDLLNWTMLAPYRWTPLGYVHAMFMFTELSFVLFFWGQVGLVAREQPRAIFSRRILFVVLCSLVFLRLLLGDYGYFA
ncbi:MAG: hypothetical protein KGN00_08540 [Chloroflexota bacterium]|nr:hypothetical protein [Chloroflexota bacterium]MDE3193716.1 hypothetical protein [Chloroflexota bacterium]